VGAKKIMIKFGHTSDWHFGSGRRLTPRSTEYLDRHVAHLMRLLDMVKEMKLDFLLVSGDLFENSGTTIDELLAAYKVFCEAGKICQVIATDGNHDELSVGEFQSKYLDLLHIPNVTFAAKPKSVMLHDTPQNSQIAGAKFPKVLAVPWTGIKDQVEFDAFLEKHYQKEEIVMLHECFLGSIVDSGRDAKNGVRIPNIDGVKYFACGDIHLHQKIGSMDHAWFSGAPLQQNFGEKPGKGFIVVEIHESYDWRPKFYKIPSHIELHTVSNLSEIPKDSPHWYKLQCPANMIPNHLPSNVKATDPIAPKIDLPAELFKSKIRDGEEKEGLAIDYTDGVEDLLKNALYEGSEIQEVKTEIKRIVERL
jgi:DNA repair exonuclease SbcCD nuclease subunit